MKLLYKYYLMIALPLLSCFFVVGIGLSFQMYNYSLEDKHDMLSQAAERVSVMTEELYYSHSLYHEQTLKRVITSMTYDGKIHLMICDADGEIFLTSDKYGNKYMGSFLSKNIIEKTEKNGEYSGVGTLDGLYSGENYTVGTTVKDDLGNSIAYIYVTTSINNVQQLMTYVRNLFSLLSIFVFFIAALVSYFIVKRMTTPIKEITTASSKFAKGNFSSRVKVYSNDEIGELTTAFNNMADSLEKSEELHRSFVANVSHELRSPMTSISGFVDGILDGTIPKENEEHYLRIVSDEVHRLSRLVSSMLDITMLQASDITTQKKTFDFCELLRKCVISFEQRIAERRISINIQLPPHEIYVNASEDAIYQVIYNLIDNAIKFSSDELPIDISTLEKGPNLIFSIKNYGIEIPKDETKHIFDRFHKIDRSRSKDKTGLGLGLYIAKTIINQHNGKIQAESHDNCTKFSFTLPLKQSSDSL